MSVPAISNRRRFLCGVTAAGAAMGLSRLGLLNRPGDQENRAAARPRAAGDSALLRHVQTTSRAFGTTVSIDAWHADQQTAMQAVDAAFRELALVEELMSIYRPDSQLSRLNQNGVLEEPHPHFLEVLRAAESMSRRSEGAFDITVQPLWNVFAEAKRSGALPTAAAIEHARHEVDWRRVLIAPDRIRLRGPETQITLNGIAQGYAADRAAAALVARGVNHALIDAGEIGAIGGKPSGEPWSVGVQHPRHEDAFL